MMDDFNLTEEELELDRYGLGDAEGDFSGSDAEIEDALYSQIHYDVAKSDTIGTDSSRVLSNSSVEDTPSTSNSNGSSSSGIFSSSFLNQRKGLTGETSANSQGQGQESNVSSLPATQELARTPTATNVLGNFKNIQSCVDTLKEAKDKLKRMRQEVLGEISSLGDKGENDTESNHSKYSVGKKKKNKKAKTNIAGNFQTNDEGITKPEVINLCTSSDSDVIFLGERTLSQSEVSLMKQGVSRQSAKPVLSRTIQDSQPTKINREAFLELKNGENGKRKRKRKKKSGNTETTASNSESTVTISNQAADSELNVTIPKDGTEESKSSKPGQLLNIKGDKIVTKDGKGKEGQTGISAQKEKGESSFFIDSKGMELEAIKNENLNATSSWREERERTKAMLLKERGNLLRVVGDSDDDDCMAIESHSEDEGMVVHFKGDAAKESTSMDDKSSGSWSEKRKRRDKSEVAGRYFVQSKQRSLKCFNCYEVGHSKSECPKPTRIPACILCGTKGHTEKSCPNALCFNCSLPGHQSKQCTYKSTRYAICKRCEMPGHYKNMCTDHWRQFHITTNEKDLFRPPVIRTKPKQGKSYCCNCSKQGHRYYDCSSDRFDDFTVFTYDEVAKYDGRFKVKPSKTTENMKQSSTYDKNEEEDNDNDDDYDGEPAAKRRRVRKRKRKRRRKV